MIRILILIFLAISNFAFSQPTEITVEIFNTTKDFLENKSQTATALIRNQSEEHLEVKSIIDPKTLKKVFRHVSVWMIKYKDEYYFNLLYSMDLNRPKTYIKLDIVGEYCVSIVDKDSPNIVKNSQTYYGGGANGVLKKESTKWGKNWENKNGEKSKLLFIDCDEIMQEYSARNEASSGNYLTPKLLEELFPQLNKSDKKIGLEEVLDFIKKSNKN